MNTPVTTGGASSAGGLLAKDKDVKQDDASTEAKFGDVWKNIQGKYGAKAEKPREIKKTLGKDDFLRIMVTQMRNQDPTSPFKAEQMAAQIAQFTSVEQLQNLNQGMTKLQSANQPLERLAMTNMIGKTVTVDRERFPHTEGQNETLNFFLPQEASQVSIAIVSETGEPVLTKDLGSMKKGENVFAWDGLKNNMLPAKGGGYAYRITAKDKQNANMEINPTRTAKVVGVSFEGAEPVFLVGDPRSADKIFLRNIVRIDEQGMSSSSGLIPGAQALGQAVGQPGNQAQAQVPATEPVAPKKAANFFTFEKGEGSKTLDPAMLPPETREALARYEIERATAQAAQPGAASAAGQKTADVEKGFPNGLNGDSE